MVGGSWRIEVVDGSQQTDILGWMFQVHGFVVDWVAAEYW